MNTYRKYICRIFIIFILMLMPLSILAQWSSNPMQNLGIGVAPNDQATAKMEATSDGGCFICWFDNRSGNYNMYLQRLNSAGEAQFAPNGMLVSAHPQMTWLVDYDMTVDLNDNAVIVFSDIRNGGTNDLDVVAYKIASNGTFLWGADGIVLSEPVNANFEPAPKVTYTNAGNFVVGWLKSGAVDALCFQKISADGQVMWGESGVMLNPAADHSLSAPDLIPADADNAIAIWKDSTGPFWAPTTWLYTQKFAPDGSALWNPSGVVIYNAGHMSAWTYPEIIPDGSNGAFYTWYDSPTSANFEVWVMHVDANGSLIFPVNGIQASTNSMDRLHMNPAISYLPNSDELFTFWVEENGGQNQYGLYGQKFSPTGARLWTNSGMEFLPLTGEQISFVRSVAAENKIYVGYFQSPAVMNTSVKAFRIFSDGSFQWQSQLLSAAELGSKDDLLMVMNTEHRAFLAWTDDRSGSYDIYAQNVNPDGTLGSQVPPPEVEISLTPVGLPIVIPANGGTFEFNVAVANNAATQQTVDIWTMVTLPNGTEYGPLINFPNLTMNPGWSGDRDRDQNVPANAPAGNYTYDAYAGIYPNQVYAEDHFDFSKSVTIDGSGTFKDWNNWGEDFGESASPSEIHNSSFIIHNSVAPNPFNPTTNISFELRAASYVNLTVYNISGCTVAMLVNGMMPPGQHVTEFHGQGLASGVYFYKLTAGSFTEIKKMILMK